MHQKINGRVINETGEVAVSYYQTIPHLVTVAGHEYIFSVRANICLAWIQPEHVDKLLTVKKDCCGGSKKTVYRIENEDNVRRWVNGGGR